jgi:hypothetical protein
MNVVGGYFIPWVVVVIVGCCIDVGWVIIVNIVGCIDTTNSKAKRIVDGVHKPWEVFTDVIPHQVCQNCFVPTGDIEPNASRADLALVRDDASDRHVVPTVTIPAKDRTNH